MMATLVTAALWLALGAAGRANAFEAEHAFAKGTKILGLQANGGVQNNIQDETRDVGDRLLNAGYRLQHFSNGNTSRPNRGYNANTGVVGVSFFFH